MCNGVKSFMKMHCLILDCALSYQFVGRAMNSMKRQEKQQLLLAS